MDCPDVSQAERADEPATYGADLAYHVDSAHFTVQWDDPAIDPDRAAAISATLEEAWVRLVDTDGWAEPQSSNDWRLWVILTTDLAGSGYTTLCTSADYPDGYPVTWLNPSYNADEPDYGLSVAVHEFAHALEYRVRRYDARAEELWFWEATAEWLAGRGAPANDAYAASSRWYAEWPEADAQSVANQHDYGMFLLVAWFAEQSRGDESIRLLWTETSDALDWTYLIEAGTGWPFGDAIRDMAGAVAAHGLADADLYAEPERLDTLDAPGDRTAPRPGLYGTWYVDVPALEPGEEVYVDPELLVGYAQEGWWGTLPPEEGPFVMTITRADEQTGDFTYGIRTSSAAEEAAACGCSSGGSAGGAAMLLAAALTLRRARSGDRRRATELP